MFFILNGSHSFCKNPYYYTNYSQVPSPGILSKFWELSIITYGNPVVVLDPSVRKPRQLFIIKEKKKYIFVMSIICCYLWALMLWMTYRAVSLSLMTWTLWLNWEINGNLLKCTRLVFSPSLIRCYRSMFIPAFFLSSSWIFIFMALRTRYSTGMYGLHIDVVSSLTYRIRKHLSSGLSNWVRWYNKSIHNKIITMSWCVHCLSTKIIIITKLVRVCKPSPWISAYSVCWKNYVPNYHFFFSLVNSGLCSFS